MNNDAGGSAGRPAAGGRPGRGRVSDPGEPGAPAWRGLTSAPAAAGRPRLLTSVAAAGTVVSVLIMIALSLVRDSWGYPPIALPAWGPPWALPPGHVSLAAAAVALWVAVIVGTVGVIAGLAAIERGARPSVRWLLAVAAVAVAVLTVLPPAGSTDAFDYAAYGRILLLGHNPYVTTPYHLRLLHGPFAASVPVTWEHLGSVYGPLATLEQYAAARLGGISAARVTFWLKLWNSAAFGVVALAADRLLRTDPARRLRAHLLWTLNPLLLWDVVAAGHLDVLAAAAGLLGLLALGEQPATGRPPLQRVLAAGALTGVAADIKVNYALFGLGVAWALRRSPAAVAAAACAALAVLAPGYAWFGMPALRTLASRGDQASAGSFYNLFLTSPSRSHVALIAAVLAVTTALLALRRMPAGIPARPALRAALAISAAWLFFWPYQYPWYDTMIICLLILYPASRLDWLVLARIATGTLAVPLASPGSDLGHLLGQIHLLTVQVVTPLVLLAAAAGLVALCLTGQWKLREPGAGPGPPLPGRFSPRRTA